MRAKIEDGYLWLDRVGKLKRQGCPYQQRDNDIEYCGDWCPLFDTSKDDEFIIISLCQKSYAIADKDFTDERGGEK